MTQIPDGFKKICKKSNLKDRQGKRYFVEDVDIAVFLVDGEIYAVSNVCPHQHAAVLYDGFIENGCVVCPSHGWEFDLKTGKQGGVRKGIDTYEVFIDNDDVYVKAFEKAVNWNF